MNDKELWLKEKQSKLFQQIKYLFSEDDVFWNNEIMANGFVNFALNILLAILVASYVLVKVGIFEVPMHHMNIILIINVPLIMISGFICRYYKYSRVWIKYLLCIVSILVCFSLCSSLKIFVTLIICIPVLLSTRYYSRKFTILMSILSMIALFISELVYASNTFIDLNLVTLKEGSTLTIHSGLRDAVLNTGFSSTTYLQDLIRGSFVPNLLLFILVSFICYELARRAHAMVLEQEDMSKKSEGMKTELEMATTIQTAVLPKIFPAFPTRAEVDIYAKMYPAKQVGGDLYDYYFIDDDHLVVVIADVSGKGVPAALFMMITKALIKTYAEVYQSPGKIASEVNKQLCDEDEVDMFVTAWIGIVEISTGIVTAVDCGHEYPMINHVNGEFELLKKKKSFVLGGMPSSKFHEYTFKMEQGDTLFLYTDGVTEATESNNKLYGMDRLESIVRKNSHLTPTELLKVIKEDVDEYVNEAPQFDDLTMLALHLNNEEEKIKKINSLKDE